MKGVWNELLMECVTCAAARRVSMLRGIEYVSVTLVVMDVAVCAAGADKSCIS